MRYLTTIFLIFSMSYIQAQIDFEFFELNENDKAKVLIQRQIDTLEVNDDFILQHYELKQIEVWDTAFMSLHTVEENMNIASIQSLGKVTTETILVKKTYSIIKPNNLGIDCYNKYPVQKETLEKSAFWVNNGDLLNEKSWFLDTLPNQIDTVFKYGVNKPYGAWTIEIPARYITIKRFVPNENLSKTELELINKICPIKRLHTFKTYDYKKIPKMPLGYPNRYTSYQVTQNATIKSVKVLTEKELNQNIILLKKALINNGYSITVSRKIDDEFKRALIQFQLGNDLPIGQFDWETVNLLLD